MLKYTAQSICQANTELFFFPSIFTKQVVTETCKYAIFRSIQLVLAWQYVLTYTEKHSFNMPAWPSPTEGEEKYSLEK